ncbi:unnamed protein product [Prorocentrum cordatum]|uniref:Uncharacterized protein n=1 Tax=Prorocentrum cordatum TaxID=2364126 RepID=A0ABN9UYW5_9DINO|nr:unnamed protein product [Polarella glacialis]
MFFPLWRQPPVLVLVPISRPPKVCLASASPEVIEAFFCEKMAVVENDAEGQEAAESVLVAAADVFNRTGSYYVRGPGGVAAIQDDLAGLYCAVSRDGVVPDCDAHATSAQHHFHSARSAPT